MVLKEDIRSWQDMSLWRMIPENTMGKAGSAIVGGNT